jgi:hypothetical protein
VDDFRFYFAYAWSMSFHGPKTPIHDFVIECKRCKEHIAAPVETMPGSWIIAECPLCKEKRRYLPVEIFKGRLSFDFEQWVRKSRRRA